MSENTKALVPIAATPKSVVGSLGEIERVAKWCAASGYYKDVQSASQAVVKMLAGQEVGIGPIQALASIHLIEGKPSFSATLQGALVKRSGRYDYRVASHTDKEAVLEWFQDGSKVGVSRFNLDDAKRAGLANKGNWQKYPRAMCFARALTEGIRTFCPDSTHGVVYTPEELNPDLEVTASGDVIEIEPPQPIETLAPPDAPMKEDAIEDAQFTVYEDVQEGEPEWIDEQLGFGKHKEQTWRTMASGNIDSGRHEYLKWLREQIGEPQRASDTLKLERVRWAIEQIEARHA